MCTFQVSVSVRSEAEADDATARLQNMIPKNHILNVVHKKDTVTAIIDHPTITCTLKMAGWVKDSFGMHPFFRPAVQMIS